jgi:cyanophycinase
MAPKGKLLIIGGAEYKGENDESSLEKAKRKSFRQYEILGELLHPDKNEKHRIEVITTASEIPEEVSLAYRNAFRKIGFQNVHHINIQTKEDTRNEDYIRRIDDTNVVLFSGGDQFRLATILGGTEVLEKIVRRYKEDKDFIIAGTSAGAMVMSKLMIFSGQSNESLLIGDVKITSGFGLMGNCIIDTHFIKRGRFGRLAQAIIMNPSFTGIGLGEDTALIIKKGNEAECRGSGMVIIIDAKEMGYTNLTVADEATPLCVENLKVHILARGDGYHIKERKFVAGKPEKKPENGKERKNHNGKPDSGKEKKVEPGMTETK